MKKKLIFFITLLIASVLFVPNAFAATAPELVEYGGKNILLANGTAITIEATTTEGMGATVKWDGGQIEVPANVTIFGGMHNSTEAVDTSITMNGGTVKNVFGGGLHVSTVKKASIVVNGGTITSAIMGGGYEEFVNCGKGDFNAVAEADVLESTTKVEETSITVNGGNLDGIIIYGGGGAHAYTGTASIVLNDFEGKLSYLVAGGSNGHTEKASVELAGGEVEVLQSVNRGTMDTIEMTVSGGKVTNAYVGGEPDKSVTGTFNNASLEITGGEVENVSVGSNGYDATNNESISAKDDIVLSYNKNAVTNIDETEFAEDSVVKTVKLTFSANGESESVEIPVGTELKAEEIEELEKELTELLADTGYKFDNFYADAEFTKVFDMTKPFDEDTTVYLKFVQLRQETDGTTNPDTSDISLYGTIIAILLAAAGLGYTIKKRRFN